MRTSLIAACGLDMTIGKDGRMPWHLPADLRYFMDMTMGKPMIMGRRTYQTLPGPLKGRLNIVLTRQDQLDHDGIVVAHSLDQALNRARREAGDHGEVMVLGGATVYAELMAGADRIYLTVIHHTFAAGDTFFPRFDIDQWTVASVTHHEADADNAFPYSFFKLDRRADAPVDVEPQESGSVLPAPLRQR